jgi:hypothetical protein
MRGKILTIELDGMDVCTCKDAYEGVAHLFFEKKSQREYTCKSANRTRANAAPQPEHTHLMKPDREQPANSSPQKVK